MVRPLTMSLAACAATPVSEVMKPILIGGAWAAPGAVSSARMAANRTATRAVVMVAPPVEWRSNGLRLLELSLHVGAALPGHLLERDLGLGAVREADDHGLREH